MRLAELPSLVDTDLRRTSSVVVDEDRVDTFAAIVGAHRWLHLDPERAGIGAVRPTVSHGSMTLSLFAPLWSQILEVVDAVAVVDDGADRACFMAPVRTGSTVTLEARLVGVDPVEEGLRVAVGATFTTSRTIRPVCVAELRLRYLGDVAAR